MGGKRPDDRLAELNEELSRLRRRAARQKRNIAVSTDAWQVWSDTIDEALRLVSRMAAAPVSDPVDLSKKFRAILWAIETNDSLVDDADRRLLRAFDRDLRRLG
jgi:hypothetical protein